MASNTELTAYIRFQLSQLKALNKHHEFEHIARHFARLRICSNILLATGPVSAGGDGGKDFETYQSYLINTPIAGSTFLGMVSGKKIVFACSIQRERDITTKIKADIQEICNSTTKIDCVKYFCEANIASATPDKLKEFTKTKYQADLEIFDGQQLSEELTSIDLFWIAVQYLSVPAEMYPKLESTSKTYQEYKKKWLEETLIPLNYSDFFQIKYGLRTATFSNNERPDITLWIEKTENFLNGIFPIGLKRKAIYEIAVASLRGMNNLTSQKVRINEYFLGINQLQEIAELEDATYLLVYCSTAYKMDHFQIEENKIISWKNELTHQIELLLKNTTEIQRRAHLCMIRGLIVIINYYIGQHETFNWREVLKWWNRVIIEAKKTVLFPLERFSDFLGLLARTPVGNEQQYLKLTNEVDQLITKRSGGDIAARKCMDRATSCYDSEQYTLAIKHLHQSKIHWFVAETLHNSILSMLLISECYERLKLNFAAKYYALAAVYLIHFNQNDEQKSLLAHAFFRLASCCYSSGQWASFLYVMHPALVAHINFDDSPLILEMHEELQHLLAYATCLRVFSERFSPSLSKLVESKITTWPIDQGLRDELDKLIQRNDIPYRKDSLDELWKKAEEDLSDRPFCDLGEVRKIAWKALGIEWLIEFKNEYFTTIIAEELAAILQIILVDLTIYDLCLLPTNVKVLCEISNEDKAHIKEVPNNTINFWQITFPTSRAHFPTPDKMEESILSLAVHILNACSVLSEDEFYKKINISKKAGLISKTFFVRPYPECYSQIISKEEFDSMNYSAHCPINNEKKFQLNDHTELMWKNGKGPGYSKELSEKFIRNRYAQNIKPIKLTLLRLLKLPEFLIKVKKLKKEGFLDWQILLLFMNLSINYRASKTISRGSSEHEYKKTLEKIACQEEKEDSIIIPVEAFSDEAIELQKKILFPTILKSWNLFLKKKFPDISAVKIFLDVRYNNSIDDIEHLDYWNSL